MDLSGTETAAVASTSSTRQVLSDLVSLAKPSVSGLNLVVVLGAYAMAGGSADPWVITALALGTLGIIASAGAANMVIERDTDRLMARTASRALPRGRLLVRAAVLFTVVTGVLSVPLMLAVHWSVAALGVSAWFGYVCVYTPMKRRHPSALLVGAVPGAVPPLMGWAAATGAIELPAVLLFLVLIAWQMAHFLGIALYRLDDYRRAGLKTVAVVHGAKVAKIEALAWTIALLATSLALIGTSVVGWLYGFAAAALGGWVLMLAVEGMKPESGVPWARRFFLSSVIYLPLLILALAVDGAM